MASIATNSAFINGQQMLQALHYEFSSNTKSVISYLCGGWSSWQLLFTLMLVMITYDQGLKLSAYVMMPFGSLT
jgi:hypothetical protein